VRFGVTLYPVYLRVPPALLRILRNNDSFRSLTEHVRGSMARLLRDWPAVTLATDEQERPHERPTNRIVQRTVSSEPNKLASCDGDS
jgi:hypothetical protein